MSEIMDSGIRASWTGDAHVRRYFMDRWHCDRSHPWGSMTLWHVSLTLCKPPRSVGAQYATGDQWRNNSRKNEGMEPKQKQYSAVDVTGDRSKFWCCKEQYCIGTWNVRSMNQGKLEVVKQEMARVNADIRGISKLKWTGMGEFNSDDHYIGEGNGTPLQYSCLENPMDGGAW